MELALVFNASEVAQVNASGDNRDFTVSMPRMMMSASRKSYVTE